MLRRQFAEKANQVGPWIERQMDAVTAIGMGLQVRCRLVIIVGTIFRLLILIYLVHEENIDRSSKLPLATSECALFLRLEVA